MSKKNPKTADSKDPRRFLPSVTALLNDTHVQGLMDCYSRTLVLDVIHEVLASIGKQPIKGDKKIPIKEVVAEISTLLAQKNIDRLRPVINAMGIVLHTGLGRAPLTTDSAKALSRLHQCCNLQIDMDTGLRGRRNYMTESLLCKLTGAEAAMVVNNNAAGTFLVLLALCKGKEVIISRGQLIEIGGSFRLPDCMRQSGSIMKEVGTTNKTHLRDYENAFSENTGAILRVFPSNYRVIGFTKQVPIEELATLKKKQPFILIDDLGCGALVDLEKFGLPKEPTVPESIAAGADLVCSSGDKLIGGPQAGIIVGKKEIITRLKKHPMTRMLRVCKMTDITLEHTLRLFLEPETLLQKHPTLGMITIPASELKKRAARLKTKLQKEKLPIDIRVAQDKSAVGGGTMPDYPLDTFVLAIKARNLSPEELNSRLRTNNPAIIARISNDEIVMDMRTLLDGEDLQILEALKRILTP